MSLFDFDRDGKAELVHRDEEKLRIIDGNGNDLASIDCYSAIHTEYPVIVDLDRDGHADILVSGNFTGSKTMNNYRIIRYGSTSGGNWAPARPVWNQHACHPLHINDDLSVPAFPLNPAVAVFAGADGVPGSDDDVRPYNNFLQQQMPADLAVCPTGLCPM